MGASGMNNVLIVGGTSDIARALAERLADEGYRILLAGRDEARLREFAVELTGRCGAEVPFFLFQADDYDGHERLLREATAACGRLDGLIVCYGYLGDKP